MTTALLRPWGAGAGLRPGWREGELFHGLDDTDLRCVRTCLRATTVDFVRDDRIVATHDHNGRIGVVLSGVLLDVTENIDGTSSVVDVIEPGGLFGDGWESDSDAGRVVIAPTAGRAILLRADRLVEGYSPCAMRPRVVDNFLRASLAKSQRLRAHLELVSRRSLRERILHYLRAEADRAGRADFTIPLSRAQLADFLHADRAAISRELSRLRADGLLTYRRSAFVLTGAR